MSDLQTTANALVSIVEGVEGLSYGTWRDRHGCRLKDTKEWVAFYVESKRFPVGDVTDVMEFIEEKGLMEELQHWMSGPLPAGVIDQL